MTLLASSQLPPCSWVKSHPPQASAYLWVGQDSSVSWGSWEHNGIPPMHLSPKLGTK